VNMRMYRGLRFEGREGKREEGQERKSKAGRFIRRGKLSESPLRPTHVDGQPAVASHFMSNRIRTGPAVAGHP
jgi:hypothetical protein